jgi:hypothetical protein
MVLRLVKVHQMRLDERMIRVEGIVSAMGRLGVCVLLLWGAGVQWKGDAAMVWDQSEVRHVAVPGETFFDARYQFVVEDRPVKVLAVRSSCGCTTAQIERRLYQVGEKVEVVLHFEYGERIGLQQKLVEIETDDPEQKLQRLRLEVRIPQVLSFEPRFLYWKKGEAVHAEQFIGLVFDVDQPIRIVSVSADTPQLQLRLIEEQDKPLRIGVLPVIAEGAIPFFRAVISVEVESELPLRETTFYAYVFMKNG